MDLERILPLLVQIDLLPKGSTGAFVFGLPAKPEGTILVESRQICWAVAATLGRRLSDLIEKEADGLIESGLVDMVYEDCRLRGAPLGETLVDLEVLSAPCLRRVLLRHTVESIAVLSDSARGAAQWVEHKRKGYNPKFTFAPQEVLEALESLSDTEVAALTP